MKAAVVREVGAVPVFGAFADPVATGDSRVVRVEAAALNQLTRARASGSHYSSGGQVPFVPGVDGVGRLDDGSRVYFMMPKAPYGAMAELALVPAANTVPVPEGLDPVTAAAIANAGMSSWAALVERAHLVKGETVLVNGATGSSGRLAVRIARHLGAAKVIATGRNREVLEALGADQTIALSEDEAALEQAFAQAVEAGVDVVLDYIWGASARALLVAAAKALPEGKPLRFVQIGNMSGAEIALPAQVLRAAAIELIGSGFGSVPMDRLLASIGGVFGAAGTAGLSLPVDATPLREVKTAWQAKGADRIVFTI
jgi:NADPH2:quinone reductase